MKKYTVQYLIGFNYNVPYCKSQTAFLTMLTSIEGTELIGSTKFKYKSINIYYKIKSIDKKDEKIKYYDIAYTIKSDSEIQDFTSFLSSHKKLISNISSKDIETIWNDISLYYSEMSYPLIHEIENLMRNLITKFMVLKVDSDWTKLKVPDSVKNSIKGDKNKRSDYLYEVDFIQLSNFLFNKYAERNITELFNELEIMKDSIEKSDLIQYIPKSNWDRYFSELVECDDRYIVTRWEKLYKLRCKVAHNKNVIKNDYDQIERLASEVKVKLEKALNKLSAITISLEEKEEISVNFAITKNTQVGDFLKSYNALQKRFNEISNMNFEIGKTYRNTMKFVESVQAIQSICPKLPNDYFKSVYKLHDFRNRVVHGFDQDIDDDEINEKIEMSERLADKLEAVEVEMKHDEDKDSKENEDNQDDKESKDSKNNKSILKSNDDEHSQ